MKSLVTMSMILTAATLGYIYQLDQSPITCTNKVSCELQCVGSDSESYACQNAGDISNQWNGR